ncbi:MAG: ATP-binding protein, partial [Gammaproteobacteria bacterium]|nr:ATP-binding protein [Gammaproteobacteria bacterium]
EATTRTVEVPYKDKFENELITFTFYHEPISSTIKRTQKNVLGFIIIFLTVLASLLVYSIRNKIYMPLSTLVNATEAATNGDKEILLDIDRKDEFGHLSIFFKKMLDRLNEQHNQLKESAEEAKRANSAKSVFLANMSHELRTPLNAIIGYSELIIEDNDGTISGTHEQDVRKIVSAGHHLLHLINEILDLSKVEAGKLEVDPDNIDLSDMFNELAVTIRPLVEQNNNKLVVNCAPQIGTIYSDGMKVRQILINLLGNACKFTKEGIISLKAEVCKINSNQVSFSVSDTGNGIKKEYIDSLFQPFTQGDESLTRSHGGTGLGLSICQRLSILLGGEIKVDSVEGKGTTFTVRLPIKYVS